MPLAPADPAAVFADACRAYERGDAAAAETLCRRMLAGAPADPGANHLLGLIALGAGQPVAAARLIGRAVAAAPHDAAAYGNLGAAWLHAGQPSAAVATLRRAVRLVPGYAEAWGNLAVAETQRGAPAAAIGPARRAITLAPAFADALQTLAAGLVASAADPAAAVRWLERLTRLAPDRAAAWRDLAVQYRRCRQFGAAGRAARQALLRLPGDPVPWTVLGASLSDAGRHAEARACLTRAVTLDPASADGWFGLACDHMAALRPAVADRLFSRTLAMAPAYADARLGRATARLTAGEWPDGWADFTARFAVMGVALPDFVQPLWDGRDLAGRTLLLLPEQGLGDSLQMLRYLPLVAARGARILLVVPPPLLPLLAPLRHSLPGLVALLPVGAPLQPFDCWLPLMSLPGVFGTTPATIPPAAGLVTADPARRTAWAARLDRLVPAGRRRAGLVWAGNPEHRNDRNRSLPLESLAPLFQVAGWSFVSLQKGPAAADIARLGWAERLPDLGTDISDFADTAAILAELDLLIAVDTAVLHLAGVLGRPAWALLAAVPDWRWLLQRDDSPWYPSLRLFRQPAAGDWPAVIAAVAAALEPGAP